MNFKFWKKEKEDLDSEDKTKITTEEWLAIKMARSEKEYNDYVKEKKLREKKK